MNVNDLRKKKTVGRFVNVDVLNIVRDILYQDADRIEMLEKEVKYLRNMFILGTALFVASIILNIVQAI